MERENQFETEVTGPNSLQILKFVLGAVDTRNVQRIRVEIEADDPLELNGAATLLAEQQTKDEDTETDEDGEDATDDSDGSSEQREPEEEQTSPTHLPNLHSDSDARHVAETMYKHDTYLHSDEIADMIPNDANFNKRTISRTIYGLVERGMVDKQDSDRDGRMKKYRLTDKGRAVIEHS